MTNSTDRVQAIFQDARELQADALEMLALGKVRNAAEKAWGATKRASDALVLARTGDEPERGSGCWNPWTKRSGERTWSGATTPARANSMASASTTACAIPLQQP